MLLILAWAGIISFIIMMYVLLDGFDLGIGILFPFIHDPHHRDLMISTIEPIWDGNETWLVLGAACLYAAFPVAYSTLLPTLYLPIMLMLGSLVFRGIVFEFRFKAHDHKQVWDIVFFVASTLAAFLQGMVLGTFVQGYGISFPLTTTSYVWLSPFSVMTGVAVIFGYALLGATWLIMRMEDELQDKMYHIAKALLLVVGFFLVVVSVWTPWVDEAVLIRWFSVPNIFYLMIIPMITAMLFVCHFYALEKRFEYWPFLLTMGIFICGYIGFCVSDWPYIIPRAVTIWQAASPTSSLVFTMIGTVILLPLLIIYVGYSYHVFRGKVTKAGHY